MHTFKALVALAMTSIALALPEPVPQLACTLEAGEPCTAGLSIAPLCCSTGLACTAVTSGLSGILPVSAGVSVKFETVSAPY